MTTFCSLIKLLLGLDNDFGKDWSFVGVIKNPIYLINKSILSKYEIRNGGERKWRPCAGCYTEIIKQKEGAKSQTHKP